MLEAVEGELWLLEVLEGDGVPKVMCCVLRCGGVRSICWRCLEVTRRVLLCMLETEEGGLYLLEVLVVSEMSIPVGSALNFAASWFRVSNNYAPGILATAMTSFN